MASKAAWAKYWPAALFAVSNIAALTLVIKANSAVDAPADTDPYSTASQPWDTPAADDPFDPVNSSANIAGNSALLWDFGSDFDLDRPPADTGSMGFLDAAKNRLRELKNTATDAARRDKRKARERELLSRPWNLNYYDNAGNFLGRHSISPPWAGEIPPLPALDNYQLRTGGHDVSITTDGNRTMILRVDPQWFKDTASMSEFVRELADKMIVAGIQPQVEVGRTASADSALGVDAGQPGVKPPMAVVLPPEAKPLRLAGSRIPATQPLPKPPADIRQGAAPPVFDSNLGDRLPPPPDDIRNPAEPGPLPPMPVGTATATRSNGATVSRRTAGPLGPTAGDTTADTPARSEAKPTSAADPPKPEAKPEPPPEPQPEAKPEPKVRLQIQLSQIADKRRAEEAVSRLRGAGYGGAMRQSSGGLGYWVVQTRVFTSRKEANAALAKIKSMGYDAWFS